MVTQQNSATTRQTIAMMPRTMAWLAPWWSCEPGIGAPYAGAHAAPQRRPTGSGLAIGGGGAGGGT